MGSVEGYIECACILNFFVQCSSTFMAILHSFSMHQRSAGKYAVWLIWLNFQHLTTFLTTLDYLTFCDEANSPKEAPEEGPSSLLTGVISTSTRAVENNLKYEGYETAQEESNGQGEIRLDEKDIKREDLP